MTTQIQTKSVGARLVKVRGTHDGIRNYLSAQASAGTVQGWDERVLSLPNGDIEVTLHKTPARSQVRRHRDTRAEERFMYTVAAVGVGLVALSATAVLLIVATSPLTLALAALLLLGGGGTCAGLHCAGCRG